MILNERIRESILSTCLNGHGRGHLRNSVRYTQRTRQYFTFLYMYVGSFESQKQIFYQIGLRKMIIFRSYPIAKTGCCCYWCRFGRMVFVALCDDISLCACQKRVFIETRTTMMMAYMRKSTTCARRLLQSGFDPPHNRTNTNKNACTYKLKVRIQFAPHPIGILFVFFFFILNIFCCVAVVANEMKQNNIGGGAKC